MSVKALSKGSILSETSFYVVKEVQKDVTIVNDDLGNELKIGNKYVDSVLQSADFYDKEESKNMTELAEIFVNSPRVAMKVTFITKPTEKLKKDYNKEIADATDVIVNAKVGDIPNLLKNLLENPISKEVPGEIRVMRGRHYGGLNTNGRVAFIDMEANRDTSKDYDTRSRQVDTRTIQEIIVNKVRYFLKK